MFGVIVLLKECVIFLIVCAESIDGQSFSGSAWMVLPLHDNLTSSARCDIQTFICQYVSNDSSTVEWSFYTEWLSSVLIKYDFFESM